jgi:SAM-dependent methyltransferase
VSAPSPADGAGYAGRTKYDAARAARYAARSARRDAEEWDVVVRLLADVKPPRTVLDAPCGTGRIAARFLKTGAAVRLADLSPDMLAVARATVDAAGAPAERVLGIERLDLESPPPADAHRHDLVVCLRFLHHLGTEALRARVLASLRARSSDRVVVSFHHPASLHHLARALRRLLTGRRGDRHAIGLRRLVREAANVGLVFERAAALARWRRDFWVARFRVA